MSKRMFAVAVAAALAMALGGCVAIPTSGAVNAGPAVDEQVDSPFVTLANGPQAGASQEEILLDFIRAANSPKNEYGIAKQFLTDEMAETWDPDRGVLVRGSVQPVTRTSDITLDYSFTLTATVDAGGRYAEQVPATQVLPYTFTQVDGEWRISGAPDGVVLSENGFRSVFVERSLYFFDPTFTYLVPDVRWFPNTLRTTYGIVAELLAGPSSWLQPAVLSEFPTATTFIGLTQEGSELTIDLSEEATTADDQSRLRMVQQLEATLGNSSVEITVAGLPLSVPESNAVGPIITPTVGTAPLVAFEGEFGFATAAGITALDNLAAKVVGLNPTAATLASDSQSIAVRAGDGSVYVARTSAADPTIVDSRANLIAPSIDSLGFVWSAPSYSVAELAAFDFDGTRNDIDSPTLPAGAGVASFAISRDGTRIALYLQTAIGPQLGVAGIVRSENVPIALSNDVLWLPVPVGTPLDLAWVDNHTIATLSAAGELRTITAIELGGPTSTLGQVAGATTIVGGNGGTNGIRVLADTQVYRPQGGGWQDSGIDATLLATQQ